MYGLVFALYGYVRFFVLSSALTTMKMKTFTVAATAANLHPLYHPAERGEAVFLYGMPLTISALVMGGEFLPVVLP